MLDLELVLTILGEEVIVIPVDFLDENDPRFSNAIDFHLKT